jgi:cell division septation protein DedD
MFRMDLASSESIAPSRTAKGEAPRVRSWQAAAIVAGALGLAAIGGTKDNVRTTVQQATIDWNVSDWFQSQKSTLIRTWDSWAASVEEFVTPVNEPVREDATLPASQPAEVPASEAESKPAAKEPAAKEPAAKEPAAKEPAAKGANEPISANLANLAKKANEPVSTQKPTSQPANEPVSTQKPTSQRADQPYALIVGAFADDANAIRLVSDLKKSGFPAEVLDAKVGLKKVALRTFASEDAARKAKDQLKGDFPAIWIYHE